MPVRASVFIVLALALGLAGAVRPAAATSPVTPHVTAPGASPFARIAGAIDAVIAAKRAQLLPTPGVTHCSELVQDVVASLLGRSVATTTFQLPANHQGHALAELAKDPAASGWTRVSGADWITRANAAALAAGSGKLALLTWINPAGHGHIAIVNPPARGGVTVAQAGPQNAACGLTGVDKAAPITCVLRKSRLQAAVFYLHDIPAP